MRKKIRTLLADAAVFTPILRRSAPVYTAAVILSVLAALGTALSPLLLGSVIDRVGAEEWDGIYWLIAGLGAVQLTVGAMRGISGRLSATRSEEMSHELRDLLMRTIFHDAPDHWRFQKYSRGKLLSMFNRDIEALWDFFGFAMTDLVSSVIMMLALSGIIFWLSAEVGILFLVITTVFCLAFYDNGRRIRAHFADAAPKFDRLINLINALLEGYDTIAAFRRQSWARHAALRISRQVTGLANAAHRRATGFTFLTGAMNTAGVMTVWALCLPDMIAGEAHAVSVGGLVAIMFYFNMIVEPLDSISHAAKAIGKGSVSMSRLADFVRRAQQRRSLPSSQVTKTPAISGKPKLLQLEAVHDLLEREETGGPILKPASFSVSEGDIIGLVGASGSGKSTLLRLLARMIPGTGRVHMVNGVGITNLDEDVFRETVAYIPQHPVVFPQSLTENLFTQHEEHAVRNGLIQVGLESRGEALLSSGDLSTAGLSGGEAQRLALARLLFHRPGLLLIDEPTSALDYDNSVKVCNTVFRHMSNGHGAALVASHDPVVLQRCTTIHLMKDGEIVASGSFEQLTRDCAYFNTVIISHEAVPQ